MQTPATADTEGQPLRALIRAARRTLDDAGVPSPAADARILARHVLECTDGGILELVDEVSPAFEDLFDSLVERRARREPLQLITGEVHFHAVRLATAPGVFIPRPETEQLTESAIRALLADDGAPVGTSDAPSMGVGGDDGAPVGTSGAPSMGVGGDGGGSVGTSGAPSMGVGGDGEASVGTSGAPSAGGEVREVAVVVDLCAGSGAVAIAIARAVPAAQVWAVELDPAAAALAERNARENGTGVVVVEGNAATALRELDGRVDVVVANPPYIPPDGIPRDPEVHRWDPPAALYGGGEDGLEVPRAVVGRAKALLRDGGTFLMEHGDQQGAAVRGLVEAAGGFTMIETRQDLAGRDRYVVARREREERR